MRLYPDYKRITGRFPYGDLKTCINTPPIPRPTSQNHSQRQVKPMSYYNSKNPGLYAYVTLLCMSALALILMPQSNIVLGALSVLWGMICMMRTLSLFEVHEYFENRKAPDNASKQNNNQATGLAYDLAKRMNGNNYFKRGLAALECIDPRTLLWFAMAGLYTVSSFYFNHGNNIETIAYLFMIGAAFWLGQSYAYSNAATYIIAVVCTALLTYAFITLNPTISVNIIAVASQEIITNPALIMLIALMAYSAGVLMHALIENPRQSALTLTGIAILLTLSALYFSLDSNPKNIALWLPAWSLFSLIWIRAYKAPKKRYTLYPC